MKDDAEHIPWDPEDGPYDPNDEAAVDAFFEESNAFKKELEAAGIALDDYEGIRRFKERLQS